MVPDFKILRHHDEIGFYELIIGADVIEFYKNKFHKEKKEKNININHGPEIYDGATLTQSFLIDKGNRDSLPGQFQELPDGTWMVEYTFDRPENLSELESQNINGFSVEGNFTIEGADGKKYSVYEKFRIMNKLSDLLRFNIYVQGGGTDGHGRNEHGSGHFELKEKNSGHSLGKIDMPTLEHWKSCDYKSRIELMTVKNATDISKREKKVMVSWLELRDNENLISCHKEWNEKNKDNNRVTFM